jgi:putative tryptophan/tyrosine transport system substrate-binding protein
MRRRAFITLLGGAATWPFDARAQQPAMPVIGFVNARSAEDSGRPLTAFRRGLAELGYVEAQNVAIEYHWLEGNYDQVPSLVADLVRRRVAVIAAPGTTSAALAAKAATSTIPIVFGVSEDPVKLGLVASLARPGSNATGVNFFLSEIVAKRLGLLHELVPQAVRVAVLVNPGNRSVAEATLQALPEAARASGVQINVLKASTSAEIEAAFATIARERADAVFMAAPHITAMSPPMHFYAGPSAGDIEAETHPGGRRLSFQRIGGHVEVTGKRRFWVDPPFLG